MKKDSGITEVQLSGDYYYSPGFYMNYWHNIILHNFPPEVVALNAKLKNHREVWIGAHLAALKTKLTGRKYFVTLPLREPPDVIVAGLVEVTAPSGRKGNNLDPFSIENTRCDISSGENLFDQIQKKNTTAYEGIVLTVYLQGAERLPNLEQLAQDLKKLPKIYPKEILIMVQLLDSDKETPNGPMGFVQVYPNLDDFVLRRDDNDAYFSQPSALKITGRGVQDKTTYLGMLKLMKPQYFLTGHSSIKPMKRCFRLSSPDAALRQFLPK